MVSNQQNQQNQQTSRPADQQNHRPTQPPPARSTTPRKVKCSAPGLTCICRLSTPYPECDFQFPAGIRVKATCRTGVKASSSLQARRRASHWAECIAGFAHGQNCGEGRLLDGRRVGGSGCKGFVRLAVIDDGSACQQRREQSQLRGARLFATNHGDRGLRLVSKFALLSANGDMERASRRYGESRGFPARYSCGLRSVWCDGSPAGRSWACGGVIGRSLAAGLGCHSPTFSVASSHPPLSSFFSPPLNAAERCESWCVPKQLSEPATPLRHPRCTAFTRSAILSPPPH